MPIATVPLKLLVIVGEAQLHGPLVDELQALGVSGCTISHASGWGGDAHRKVEWERPSVRLETVVSAELADRIFEVLVAKYFPRGSVAAWVSDVQVVRREKYVGPRPGNP